MVSFYFVLLLSLFGLCSGLVAPTNIRFFRTSTFRTQTKITYQRISRIYADIIDIPNQIAFNEATTRNEVNIPIVIDFQKSNCRPCIKVAPLLRNLANKYENKVKFYKVDADSSKECLMILKENNVKAVPTFQVWINGQQIDVIQGAKLEELENVITDAIESIHKI